MQTQFGVRPLSNAWRGARGGINKKPGFLFQRCATSKHTEGLSNFDSAAHDLFGVLYFSIWDMKGKDFRADGDIHIRKPGGVSSDGQKKKFFMYLFIYLKKKVAITVAARPGRSLWLNLPEDELMEG